MNREPLLRRLLGPAFDELPAAVRAVHAVDPPRFSGHCEVTRGEGILSRLCGAIVGLPPPGERVPVAIDIASAGEAVTWRRDFGGHPFRSTLHAVDGLLEESVGLTSFRFQITPGPDGNRWDLVGMRVLGIPVPRFARAVVDASESVRDGAYWFDVRAALPVAGLLVHYRGTLEPERR